MCVFLYLSCLFTSLFQCGLLRSEKGHPRSCVLRFSFAILLSLSPSHDRSLSVIRMCAWRVIEVTDTATVGADLSLCLCVLIRMSGFAAGVHEDMRNFNLRLHDCPLPPFLSVMGMSFSITCAAIKQLSQCNSAHAQSPLIVTPSQHEYLAV